MANTPFKNALFLSNFTIDMGDPNFRTGAYSKFLEPMADSLSKVSDVDVKFLASKHTFDSITRDAKASKIKKDNTFIVDYQRSIDIFGFGDWFIRKSYNDEFTNEEKAYISGYFKSLFGNWEPDLIVSWEFPTTILRSLFPDALVIDLMPGLFMRPPYPRTISIDPSGLYKDSAFSSQIDPSTRAKATDQELDNYYRIRDHYETFYRDHKTKDMILSKFQNPEKFNKFALVPLQISQYFGFHENTPYTSQFDFLLDVLRNTPEDTGVIATQYISGLLQEKAINDKNIDFLHANFPNFLYSKEFEKVDNISQYIVPWADITYSVSSTIGLQTKFFDKKLISPSRSHLAYFADETELGKDGSNEHNDHNMALLLNRGTFLESRLINEPQYLLDIFTEMAANKKNGKTGIDLLAGRTIHKANKETPLHYIATSSQHAAERQLAKLGGSAAKSKKNELKDILNKMEEASIVSFDVFDTLLCRSVFKPEDVFLLMQKELASGEKKIDIPSHIIGAFAELRKGVERQLRQERDAALKLPECELQEEILIEDVYRVLIEQFGGSANAAQELVDFEQEMEFRILKPRPVGKFLFDEAVRAGKQVIIISDFIHDKVFVSQALKNAGITQYDHLFVSANAGMKKHSGDLFHHVVEQLSLDTNSVLHIGDNAIGDLAKGHEAGWTTMRITSARERALDILKNRDLSPAIVDKSFFLRTSLSLFAEEFFNTKTYNPDTPKNEKENRNIVESGFEFGYLALGPIMYNFSEWILKQAKDKGCTSIVFFARDCYLPHKVTKKILETRQDDSIEVHYIPASRKGLMGLNLYQPEDFLKVRIDDFNRRKTLADLIESRFGLDPYTFSQATLDKWGVEDIDVEVRYVTSAAVYGIVLAHVRNNWEDVSAMLDDKRDVYTRKLKEIGVDLSKDTLALDFGYKGSTHKMIRELFQGEFHPAFFMTFADDFGRDPIENAASFYMTNLNPVHKNGNIMLSHNLIIETLVNEPTGSLIEVIEQDGEIRTVKEELGSADHLSKVNAIHQGVLKFADSWLGSFQAFPSSLATLEMNSAEYFLSSILRKPVVEETDVLKGLLFDNAFAGHANRYILSPNAGAKDNQSIWKEGHRVYQASIPKKNSNPVKKPAPKKKPEPPVKQVNTPAPAPAKPKQQAAPKKPAAKAVPEKKKAVKKPAKIVLQKNKVMIGDQSYPKQITALKVLHRNEFIEVISWLAKLTPSEEVRRSYADMIKENPKTYVAARLLNEYGGISKADISKKDKLRSYRSLMMKK